MCDNRFRLQIKTLRLATSYIAYLNGVLEGDQDPAGGFRAELVPSSRKINAERRAKSEAQVLVRFQFNRKREKMTTAELFYRIKQPNLVK